MHHFGGSRNLRCGEIDLYKKGERRNSAGETCRSISDCTVINKYVVDSKKEKNYDSMEGRIVKNSYDLLFLLVLLFRR